MNVVEPLAQQFVYPASLQVDQTCIYVADRDDGAIWRLSKEGGEARLIARDQGATWSLAADDHWLYWTSAGPFGHGAIMRASKSGSAVDVLVPELVEPHAVIVDADRLYWLDAAGALMASDKNGGKIHVLHCGVVSGALTMDRDHLYWWEGCRIVRTPKVGDGAVWHMGLRRDEVPQRRIDVVAEGIADVNTMHVSEGILYFTTSVGIVAAVQAPGGEPRVIAKDQDSPWGLAVDDHALYWCNHQSEGSDPGEGQVLCSPKDGAARVRRLARTQAHPGAIAVDSTWVYWLNVGSLDGDTPPPDGTLQRVRKPSPGAPVQ